MLLHVLHLLLAGAKTSHKVAPASAQDGHPLKGKPVAAAAGGAAAAQGETRYLLGWIMLDCPDSEQRKAWCCCVAD
jgi:hypothetical protein